MFKDVHSTLLTEIKIISQTITNHESYKTFMFVSHRPAFSFSRSLVLLSVVVSLVPKDVSSVAWTEKHEFDLFFVNTFTIQYNTIHF